jgi:hypothetical protein
MELSNRPLSKPLPHNITCRTVTVGQTAQHHTNRQRVEVDEVAVDGPQLDGDTVEVGLTVELAGAAELDTFRVQKDVGASWT